MPECKVTFVPEPVDVWAEIKDVDGVTILEKFYTNQKRYAFPFQMMAYISRLKAMKDAIALDPKAVLICERSIWTDRNVFAKMLYDDGKIEKINYDIYLKWFDTFIGDYPLSGIIYLKTKATTCQRRIRIRSREGETIPLKYLEKCHVYHERWLDSIPYDILTLDGDAELDDSTVSSWLKLIKSFIIRKVPDIPIKGANLCQDIYTDIMNRTWR